MSQLANVNAPEGVRPPAPFVPGPDRIEQGQRVPVVLSAQPDASKLDRPLGTPRPAAYGATGGWGMTPPWPGLSGGHGLVPEFLPPDMTGGQQAWRAWNPITLRHEPVEGWDAGVVQA